MLTEFGNLISIVGGKWTTYRRMAADAMAAAHRAGLIQARPAYTERLALVVDRVLADDSARRTAPDAAFAEHCRRYAQARTNEDIVSRRARLAYLDRSHAQRWQSVR